MTLHDESGDDLGCLAHCLSSSLGFDIDDCGMLNGRQRCSEIDERNNQTTQLGCMEEYDN